MKKFEIAITAIFAIAGITLLAVAIWLGVSSASFVGTAVHVTGTVAELAGKESSSDNHSIVYYPVIEFTTADGRAMRFESATGSNPSMYRQGQEVKVLYNPADPARAMIDSVMELWFAPMLLGFIGLLFSAIGFGVGVIQLAKKNKKDWLLSHGVRIQTVVKKVSLDSGISENGISPYIIISQYMDENTRKIYIFESESIWYDPTEFVGESVTVLVDPANYKKYYMDLSFLPQKQ